MREREREPENLKGSENGESDYELSECTSVFI